MLESVYAFITRIINFITNSIESFDKYYDEGEEYISKNIKNGKIFYDFAAIQKATIKLGVKLLMRGYRSKTAQAQIMKIHALISRLLKIPVIGQLFEVMFEMRAVYLKYPRHLFFFLVIAVFPLVIWFIHLLNSSPSLFFLYLIPGLPLILIFQSMLYYAIEKSDKGEKISFSKAFLLSLENFKSVILIFLIYIFICSSLFLFLAVLTTVLIGVVTLFTENLLMYYTFIFLTVFIITLTLYFILYISVLVFQAFYVAALEGQDPIQSYLRARVLLQKKLLYINLSSLTYLFISCLLILFALFYFSDIALQFIIALILHITFLLTYSMRTKLLLPQSNSVKFRQGNGLMFTIFSIILLAGVIGYIALSELALKYYPSLVDSYNAWQFNHQLDQQFLKYTNINNKFSIFYPKDWLIYNWNRESVALHYNAYDTSSGTLTVNIGLISLADSQYNRLNVLKPGTVVYDPVTKITITKISNLLIDNYEAVKYSLVKPLPSGTEYEIDYLILQEDKVYKLNFVTVDSILQQEYSKVFEIMINTFQIIK